MTGLHATHMVIGIGVMAWMALLARRGRFTRDYYTPLELTGLYWHFVDMVWVFLFPLLYLIELHK
jgi:cytochrome c oxidase subunit 3